MVKIQFETNTDAFHLIGEASEINRILLETAEKIRSGRTSGAIFDANGNKIGKWSRQ